MALKSPFQPKPLYGKIGFVLQEHFQRKAVIKQALREQHEQDAHLFTKPSLWGAGIDLDLSSSWFAICRNNKPLDITGLRM